MIITVEDKTATIEIGGTLYSDTGSSQWEAVRNLLLQVSEEYTKLSRVDEIDLTPSARNRKKLLQEIVE